MTQLPEHRRTTRLIHRIERDARQLGTVISLLHSFTEYLMAGQAELQAKIAELEQAVADDQASDQAVVDQLDAVIAQLRADGDTTAAIASLDAIKASISTVSSSS